MRAFRFRFEQILKHKQREEERLEESLAWQEQQFHRILSDVQQTADQVEHSEERLRQIQSGEIELHEIIAAVQYLSRLRESLAEKRNELAEAKTSRDEARRLLIEAMKERKMFEKLQEKELQGWRQKENQREQRLTDEIAQRYGATENNTILNRHGGGA